MQKGWRKTRVTVGKMTSSVKKRFPTLADFRVKRKMMRQDRHAGRETPERHEHSKNAENPFIAAAECFRDRPHGSPQYISALAAALAGFSVPGYSDGDDLRKLLWRDFRNKLLSCSGAQRLDSFRRAQWSLRLARIARCRSKSSAADAWPFRSHPGRGQNQAPLRFSNRLSPTNRADDLRSGILSRLWIRIGN